MVARYLRYEMKIAPGVWGSRVAGEPGPWAAPCLKGQVRPTARRAEYRRTGGIQPRRRRVVLRQPKGPGRSMDVVRRPVLLVVCFGPCRPPVVTDHERRLMFSRTPGRIWKLLRKVSGICASSVRSTGIPKPPGHAGDARSGVGAGGVVRAGRVRRGGQYGPKAIRATRRRTSNAQPSTPMLRRCGSRPWRHGPVSCGVSPMTDELTPRPLG